MVMASKVKVPNSTDLGVKPLACVWGEEKRWWCSWWEIVCFVAGSKCRESP